MSDRQKFKSLVHYICSRRSDNPSTLGAVKLNKALWLSDLTAFYQLGQPITSARYVKQKFGPVPSAILPVLKELENEGVLKVTHADHYGKRKTEYLVFSLATDDFLSPNEREIVERTIKLVCDEYTAASISEASHDHIWKAAENGEEIPHYTVFAQPGKITTEERDWASMQLDSEAS